MTSPRASRYIVGVDLGTTHTVLAFVDTLRLADAGGEADGRAAPPIEVFDIPQLVAPGELEARPLLHSLRYHPAEGELPAAERALPFTEPGLDLPAGVVGELARQRGADVPGRLVASAKSWLSHPSVDRTAKVLPWGAPDDVAKISPVDASAAYLAHLRAAWDHRHKGHPLAEQTLVLTVPASFDEGARALTLAAARRAGLPKVRLLEEPQAAFYDWLGRHEAELEQWVSKIGLALVVDVGGGTTDMTLIQVELRESGPRLTRIAVGDHLMLGGDNMDLALAHDLEGRLGKARLGSAELTQLIQQTRRAKEQLLAKEAPDRLPVTVLGSGSKLFGGARTAQLTRAAVHERVLDGFFPAVPSDARPQKKRGAIVEFGLPYVADAAITRHIAAFLDRHADVASEALLPTADKPIGLPVPDAVLLNGGVFKGHALSERLLSVLASWRGEAPLRLENPAPELAVARGAVAYGLARRGIGVRIGGGSARSYYLLLGDREQGDDRAICLLPRGAEEGEEVRLKARTFSLKLGEPVRFSLASSTGEAELHRPGELVQAKGERFQPLPPIAAVLQDADDASAGRAPSGRATASKNVAVQLAAELSEVGTVELSCVSATPPEKRWKLSLVLRGEAEPVAAGAVTQLHPRFAEATALIRAVYGKSSTKLEGVKPVKTLRADLERRLGPRETWATPLLRELFAALLAGIRRRRRSADHERVWLNLVGYCLRPGYGYPLDEWRVQQLFAIFDDGLQFMPEAQVWSEWWTCWRRVSGGLLEAAQVALLERMAYDLMPPAQRPRRRPKGPRNLGYDDMVRLAGSLEHIPHERKVEVGGWLLERLQKGKEGPHTAWALGRLGTRVPTYGSAHNAVPSEAAAAWVEAVLALDWQAVDAAPFAATLLCRMSGDRERDLPEALRAEVATRLVAGQHPASWVRMVREVTQLEAADQRRILGDSLPPGLSLVE